MMETMLKKTETLGPDGVEYYYSDPVYFFIFVLYILEKQRMKDKVNNSQGYTKKILTTDL
ncbi:hypothetical protein T4B_4303 [Trichinella pseudospiralis]|uniref:Uncharacterized protein n=2 Tax=Trichinella pseudospiralis TaxID=6337 RepID=A0A0V1KCH0_TRIPS|nr:hypothetical protein T4A_7737 [Trichinella pseudospiralis]KRY91670.1 hypothetical protein T4D_9358 [Trichinella pseudospiralis]KRZ34107.1 hypothetical protein T4B_4303 [Trichinella pseudospiralis]KRZ44898.1 hypothetical protein T4C_6543 [Trichinella pseudospiralis]